MDNEVQEVKDKIDIVSYISQFVPLKKSGRNYKGLCPFHHEKTPSFMVSPELGIFKCFGCNFGGDVIAFLMRREGLEFRPALEELAGKAGVKLKSQVLETPQDRRRERILSANLLSAQFYHYLLLNHATGKMALDYLKSRGLKEETLEKFLLGYAPASWDSLTQFLLKKGFSVSEALEAGLVIASQKGSAPYARFRGRVIFPLLDARGRVVGFTGRLLKDDPQSPKYLNSPETPVFKKSQFLYGFNLARPAIKRQGRVILVEGQMDLISNVQAGRENVVATSGTALTHEQAGHLAKLAGEIVFAFDGDAAGQKALERGVEVCESVGLVSLVAKLPTGVKDPDEAAVKKLAEWQKSLSDPVSFYDYYFDLVAQNVAAADPLSKKKVAERMLPLIAKMSDPILKAHFIKRWAETLSLEEKFVAEALFRLSLRPAPNLTAAAARVRIELPVGERRETLQKYYLALLLRFDLALAKRSLAKTSFKDFEGSALAPLFKIVREVLADRQRPLKLGLVREKLAEDLKPLFDELTLIDLGEMEAATDLQEKEIGVVLKELKRETLKAEVNRLVVSVREAERQAETAGLNRLQKKLNAIYQKLKE